MGGQRKMIGTRVTHADELVHEDLSEVEARCYVEREDTGRACWREVEPVQEALFLERGFRCLPTNSQRWRSMHQGMERLTTIKWWYCTYMMRHATYEPRICATI